MNSRLPSLILVMTILFAPITLPVVAQESNHLLTWEVDVGEEFTYVLQREFYSDLSNQVYMEGVLPFLSVLDPGEKVIMEIDTLENISLMIDDPSELPHSYCSLLRYNDSALILGGLASLVVPGNDWEFLTNTNNMTAGPEISFVDTDDEWGTVGVGTLIGGDGSTINVQIDMRYEKENGTLSYLRHHYTTLGADLIDVVFVHWYPGMPTIIAGGFDSTTILIIITAGVVGVIIAVLVYRGIKSKKSIAQRLGE